MKTNRSSNRRKFLLAAGLGSAGAAAALVARGPAAGKERSPAETGKASGYHVSEHILKYYKTTEV